MRATGFNTEFNGKRYIPYGALERDVLEYTKKIFEIQKELGVNVPIVVALTLTRTKNLARDIYSFGGGHPIKEEHLILPESVVEDLNVPLSKVLKPMFDLIWNACGFLKSKNFDDEGNWKSQG